MHKICRTWVLAAGLGAGALALSYGGASAASLPIIPQIGASGVAEDGNPLLLNVTHPQDARRHRWNKRQHGNRCRYRNGGCRHYYRGYYYHTPWWAITLPLVVAGAASNRHHHGDDHEEWCRDRYRSYNEENNTWVSYSGRVRQCNSPYN